MKDMKINEAVGAFVKRFRAEHDLTLEEIADASRTLLGTKWTAATVSAIEHGGSKADALPTMLILSTALTSAYHNKYGWDDTDHDVSVIDLIRDTERLQITDSLSVYTDAVIGAMTGEGYEPFIDADIKDEQDEGVKRTFFVTTRREEDARVLTAAEAQEKIEALFGADGADQFKRWRLVPTAAERRAAKKLGVEPIRVAEATYLLFGATLDEVVYKFAGDGASPQKRGRVTRKVVEFLKEDMKKSPVFSMRMLDYVEWLKAGKPEDWDTDKYTDSDESIIKD